MKAKQNEQIIIWDESKPDEMKAIVMAGVQVQIPITKENHCDKGGEHR